MPGQVQLSYGKQELAGLCAPPLWVPQQPNPNLAENTFFKHSLCASPVPLMNSLCIRLCLSCWTGLSNETPKVLAHASREDH